MQAKQLVGAAAFGLVLSSTGMVQAGGVTDAATGAIRESVHGKADSMMDSVGLGKGKAAAEEKAAPAESAAEGDVAKDAAAGGDAAKDAAAGGDAAKDAAAGGDAAKDAAAEGAESAKKSAGDAIPEVPKPSVEDAAKETAKGALKGLLD